MNKFDIQNKCFNFDGTSITNPTCSTDGFNTVSPKVYGFEIHATGGGCSAWVKPYEGGFIVLTKDYLSHELGDDLNEFQMGFYDGSDDETWGELLTITTLQVGVIPDEVKA